MKKKRPIIIGIAGGSASGKSTVTKNIIEKIAHDKMLSVIQHDDYYLDQAHLTMEERIKTNYDHPLSFDNNRLIDDLIAIRNNQSIQKPLYDFTQHTRKTETEKIDPTSIVILEGILVLEDRRLRDLMDIKIFVSTPADIRFIRRLQRDVRERNRTIDSVVQQYLTTVKDMHEQFIEPSKRYADLIIPMGGDNDVAIDLLVAKIYSAHGLRNGV